MSKLIPIVFALIALTVSMSVVSVLAMTYTVTATLEKNGRILWTKTFTLEVEDDTIIVKVPQRLYDLIVKWCGTDTFTTPFDITIGRFTLHVESDPSGLTIVFEPRC